MSKYRYKLSIDKTHTKLRQFKDGLVDRVDADLSMRKVVNLLRQNGITTNIELIPAYL